MLHRRLFFSLIRLRFYCIWYSNVLIYVFHITKLVLEFSFYMEVEWRGILIYSGFIHFSFEYILAYLNCICLLFFQYSESIHRQNLKLLFRSFFSIQVLHRYIRGSNHRGEGGRGKDGGAVVRTWDRKALPPWDKNSCSRIGYHC